MKILYAIVVLLLASSCTMYHTPSELGTMLDQCETVDCIVDAKDAYTFSSNKRIQWFKRYRFMEGYPPQSLRVMMDQGRLVIHMMDPVQLLASIGFITPGVATYRPTIYGDMSRCEVWYAPVPGWRHFLNHELDHCLGYADVGMSPDALSNDYTDTQKAIMREEGVSRWIDTRFYREQMRRWYPDGSFYFYMEDRADHERP